MRPGTNPFLTAAFFAALSAAAYGQNPKGRSPGTSPTSPDPSNDTPKYGVNGSADVDTAHPKGITNSELDVVFGSEVDRKDETPKKPKRSFWDRLLGRNKHQETATEPVQNPKDDYQP
jgi:hypothetical protein